MYFYTENKAACEVSPKLDVMDRDCVYWGLALQGLIKTYEEEDHEPWGACPCDNRWVWIGEVLFVEVR